jgi:nitrite reductase/ring-hydroxylating ferredoxin subunit/DMSO/TMAO reductase YedYZ heme-binding membrane subunit
MSVRYVPVGWSRTKLVYDAVLGAGVAIYLLAYLRLGPALQPFEVADGGTLIMRAFGSCAFLLMTLVLCIGPLARLDRRFLPLLYNRRHFGVLTCLVAAGHAWHVLGWYFAFSATSPYVGVLTADTAFLQLRGFPFVPFGIGALLILAALAFTSHDFWLNFLGPPMWKRLHMGIYLAYALAVLHLAMGALQSAANPMLAMVVTASVAVVAGLHVAAGLAARRADAPGRSEAGWIDAGPAAAIAEGHGVTVPLGGGRSAAIFRDQGRLSAISNLCAHQNGPLGEGRVLDGCVTCPWHGYQYRLADGCAPAPFTEKLATFNLRLAGGLVLLDPRPNPPGTPVVPLEAPPAAAP